MVKFHLPAFAVLLCLMSASAFGQSPDGASAFQIHWGPLRVNPTIALTNLGVDDNVFNESDANHPKSDFTMTVTPAADVTLGLGRASVKASIRDDLVYYREYASERSVNGYYKIAAIVPLTRLSFNVGADYTSARDRPGFDIDARSQYTDAGYHGGMEIRAFGKTFVTVKGSQSSVNFDQDAVFMGASLKQELSRVVTIGAVEARHELTPVTSVTLDVSREVDAFVYDNLRDSASTRILGGVTFDTRLHGTASVGYRTFDPRDASVPGYQGLIALADVSFATAGSTRFGVQVGRDLQYSYDSQQPYYIQTGATASFTRELVGPVSGTLRVGAHQLAFRGLIGQTPQEDRIDVVTTFGGGIGYRLAGGMRVSLNVDNQQRNSNLPGYSYGGLRYGTAVTYGF